MKNLSTTTALEADGKSFTLNLSVNAMCQIEEKMGMGFPRILNDLSQPENIKINTVRLIFWGCFIDHHPEVTLEQAGEIMLASGGFAFAIETITTLIADVFPNETLAPDLRPASA